MGPPGPRSSGRIFEWAATTALVGFSVTVLVWPRSISGGNFKQILLLFHPPELATIFLVVGLTRGATLYLNGNLGRWGPRVRAVMSALGAVIWSMLAGALWVQLPQPSPSVAVYLSLSFWEAYSTYRATVDGRRAKS